MGLTQLDIIRKQIESAAKNRAAGEAAKLRRKTSLIGEISRLTGRANRALDDAVQQGAQWRAGRRPDILEDDDGTGARGSLPVVCADYGCLYFISHMYLIFQGKSRFMAVIFRFDDAFGVITEIHGHFCLVHGDDGSCKDIPLLNFLKRRFQLCGIVVHSHFFIRHVKHLSHF